MSLNVYDKSKQLIYSLDTNKEIARGGEGFLLPVPKNKNLVAKIYLPGCLNISEKKFLFLNKLPDKYFIKPKELFYDNSGKKILGITMEFLPKDFYPLDAIFNKNFALKHNINGNVKEKIAKQLIEAVIAAHDININIGDLSALNIMINDKGDVKLIDVDSYQVPGIPHTNKLLEEIRDYLHGGLINVNSDFFALSVVIFNYLTHLHPFKGIHNKYNTLAERMIHKIPVFTNDKDLIIPKCYEKINDKFLQDQFERLYINGERFLISIDKLALQFTGKKVQALTISEKEVTVQNIFDGETIEYAFFSLTQGMIRTKKEFILYDVSNKGMVFRKSRLYRNEWQDVFIGNKNIIITKNGKLWLYNKSSEKTEEITNINLNPDAKFIQMENYLIMIDDDFFWKINIDVVKYNNIEVEKTPVYGHGFLTHEGLIQNVGGIHYIHYHTGHNIALVKSPTLLRSLYQIKDIGIAQFEEDKKVKFKYFHLNGLQFQFGHEVDQLFHFAYRGNNLKDGIIFQPKDNTIEVLRAMDFYKLADISCSIISSNSRLFNTNSGIIALNEDDAWLINKN